MSVFYLVHGLAQRPPPLLTERGRCQAPKVLTASPCKARYGYADGRRCHLDCGSRRRIGVRRTGARAADRGASGASGRHGAGPIRRLRATQRRKLGLRHRVPRTPARRETAWPQRPWAKRAAGRRSDRLASTIWVYRCRSEPAPGYGTRGLRVRRYARRRCCLAPLRGGMPTGSSSGGKGRLGAGGGVGCDAMRGAGRSAHAPTGHRHIAEIESIPGALPRGGARGPSSRTSRPFAGLEVDVLRAPSPPLDQEASRRSTGTGRGGRSCPSPSTRTRACARLDAATGVWADERTGSASCGAIENLVRARRVRRCRAQNHAGSIDGRFCFGGGPVSVTYAGGFCRPVSQRDKPDGCQRSRASSDGPPTPRRRHPQPRPRGLRRARASIWPTDSRERGTSRATRTPAPGHRASATRGRWRPGPQPARDRRPRSASVQDRG